MITVVLAKGGSVESALVSSIKNFKNRSGVCVVLTRPVDVLKKALSKQKVNSSKMIFVDTVGKSNDSNVVHVSHENLTALSITIREALSNISSKKFLVVDTLSSLLVDNDVGVVSRFALYLIKMVRELDVDATLVFNENGASDKLYSVLAQSADKVVGRRAKMGHLGLASGLAVQEAL